MANKESSAKHRPIITSKYQAAAPEAVAQDSLSLSFNLPVRESAEDDPDNQESLPTYSRSQLLAGLAQKGAEPAPSAVKPESEGSSSDSEASENSAQACQEAKFEALAEASFPENKPLKPENPQSFYDFVQCCYAYLAEEDYDKAWLSAEQALQLGTDEPDLFVLLCQKFPPALRRRLATQCMAKTSPLHPAFQWLWVEVALSFWFEASFEEAVAEYKTILQQENLDPGLIVVIYNSLAMSLEALDRYQEAEEYYRQAGNIDAAVRAHMRSGDYQGTLALLNKGQGPSDACLRAAMAGTVSCLLGKPLPDLPERLQALQDLPSQWPYKDFMVGVMQVVTSQGSQGRRPLQRFLDLCERNPSEWGVTLRWEVGVIRDLMGILGDGQEVESQS